MSRQRKTIFIYMLIFSLFLSKSKEENGDGQLIKMQSMKFHKKITVDSPFFIELSQEIDFNDGYE